MLTRDRLKRATDQVDSTCCTLSLPLTAVPHWDLMSAILFPATRSPRSRSAFVAITRAFRLLETASASAATVKTRSATITSIRV
jgi:hypothetical protein